MRILSNKTQIDFMRLGTPAIALSLVLIVGTVYLWFEKGEEKYGIDFRGGNEFIIDFEKDIPAGDLREHLNQGGFEDAVVQNIDARNDLFSVRIGSTKSQDQGVRIRETLSGIADNSHQILREDFVGPVIGEQIRRDAIIATVLSIIGIMIYVTVRFNFAFAIGAVAAVFHDAIIAIGATMLIGKGIGAGTLAAALTILGYSVNDTIVIFDRVRENMVHRSKTGSAGKKGASSRLQGMTLRDILNLSINETMSRTIITTLTVLFVVLTLWWFGGGAVSELSFTLLIGFIAGTYSTVFIASPVAALMIRDGQTGAKKAGVATGGE